MFCPSEARMPWNCTKGRSSGMEHSFHKITPLYDLAFTCKLVPSLSLYDINRTTRSYFLVTYVHFDVQKIFK